MLLVQAISTTTCMSDKMNGYENGSDVDDVVNEGFVTSPDVKTSFGSSSLSEEEVVAPAPVPCIAKRANRTMHSGRVTLASLRIRIFEDFQR